MIADEPAKNLIKERASAVDSGMRTLKIGRMGKGIDVTGRFEDGTFGVLSVNNQPIQRQTLLLK